MAFKEALAHACRRWEAEEENARRLATRMQILATVTLGFLGVVLVQSLLALAGGKLPPEGARPWVAVWIILGLLLLLLAAALLFDVPRRVLRRLGVPPHLQRWLGVRPRRSGTAKEGPSSRLLIIPSTIREAIEIETLDHLGSDNPDAERELDALNGLYRYHASRVLNDAANEVYSRNSDEAARIGRAQVALLSGLLAISLAVVGWVYTPQEKESASDVRPARHSSAVQDPRGDPRQQEQ